MALTHAGYICILWSQRCHMSETRLPIHPYAELFAPMGHPEFDLLCGDTVPVPTNLMEREKLENNAESAHKAAELMKVSATSVRAADKVQKQGVPELVEAVAAARLAVSAAARIAGLPAEQQRQVLLQV